MTFAGNFIPEIASQAFTMGIVIGAIGAAFGLNGMGVNDIAKGFEQGLTDMPQMLAAWFMLVLQSVFNFFIVSGSGQAALTMPLMGPWPFALVIFALASAWLLYAVASGLT